MLLDSHDFEYLRRESAKSHVTLSLFQHEHGP